MIISIDVINIMEKALGLFHFFTYISEYDETLTLSIATFEGLKHVVTGRPNQISLLCRWNALLHFTQRNLLAQHCLAWLPELIQCHLKDEVSLNLFIQYKVDSALQ
jgi:hypothetical protein